MAEKKARKQDPSRVKMSLFVPANLQWRLTTLANRLRRDRSEFAVELLDQGLGRYTIDKELRRLAPPEAGKTDPPAQDGPGLTVRTG